MMAASESLMVPKKKQLLKAETCMTYIKIGVNGKMSRQKKHQQRPGFGKGWKQGEYCRV